MPFDFLKRKGPSAGAAGKAADGLTGVGTRGVPFDGLTEEWRIIGTMEISGRLSDVLNKREGIAISDVQWTPIEVEEPFTPAPGLKSIDPYDLIIVMAGAATQPPLTESQRAAYKVHKVGFDVALEAPPFRVLGTIYLYPGSEPSRLLDRGTEMFVPVVDATAFRRRPVHHCRHGGDPSEPVLPARCRADRQAHRGTRAGAARCATGRCQLAAPRLTAGTDQTRAGRDYARATDFGRLKRPNPDFTDTGAAAGVPTSRSASASKSCVMRSLGNISTTVRPSFAARTKRSPPERIWARAGMPTVFSMSATDTPLLARLITKARRSRMPSSTATPESWTAARMAGTSGVTGTRSCPHARRSPG